MIFGDDVIEQMVGVLEADPRIAAAYLFGSVARGEAKSASDLDMALLPFPGRSFGSMDLLKMGGLLGGCCHCDVDLGVLSSSNLVYAREAVLKGRRIYCRDRAFCDLFVATLLGLYAQLREERKEIEFAYTP